MMYDVTIGIPFFQSVSWLEQSLCSALSQTCPSVEFLLVDDGSTDGSQELVRHLQQTHPRGHDIRVLSHALNQGVSTSRNDIIEAARGHYLYFLDSDDRIVPETIDLLLQQARQHDADLVFGSYVKIELSGDHHTYAYSSHVFTEPDQLAVYACRRFGGIQASACNCLIRLSMLRSSGLRFLPVSYWEDFAFMNELVTIAVRAVLLPDVTYYYCCRPDSLSHYQTRTVLSRDEILRNAWVIQQLKEGNRRLHDRSYYPARCLMLAMAGFYVVRHVLRHRTMVQPPLTNRELKQIMAHPASLHEVLTFQQHRCRNLLLFLLGQLPSWLMVQVVRRMK